MRIVEESEIAQVQAGEIPCHVGCIMDGNGRWAQARDLSRSAGHAAAEESVFSSVNAALLIGIQWLTVYAFSTDNWKRDEAEVTFLMSFDEWLLRKGRRDEMDAKGVRIIFVGELDDPRIPLKSQNWLRETMEQTASNTQMTLAIAFNYGGRAEILSAVNSLISDPLVTSIDESHFGQTLRAPDMPDMDLLIRTSGEQRTSDFFPWHARYAEYVFTDTLWPDFRGRHLVSAVAEYQQRRRRMGAASTGASPS